MFLGGGTEGKSVCGARWNKGVVQEFESYEFAPKSWTLTKWHFCSIDTWLQGICRSFHPEREWKKREWLPGKQSIFAGKEEEEEDEVAGPADDDEDTVVAVGVGRAQRQKRFYVSKGNQWDLVANVLEELGWQRIPFDHKDDLNFDLRWTEVRSDIEFARFREKEQLANHVPNASVVTTKHGLIKSLRALDRQRVREGKNAPVEEGRGEGGGGHGLMGMDEFVPPTYLLNVGADKLLLLHLLLQQQSSGLV